MVKAQIVPQTTSEAPKERNRVVGVSGFAAPRCLASAMAAGEPETFTMPVLRTKYYYYPLMVGVSGFEPETSTM